MSCNNIQILNFNHNIVEVGSDNKLIITDNNKCNNITIPQPVTNILQINSPGPQGSMGPQGPAGPGGGGNIDTGSFATTGSNNFNGNQNILGNVTVTGSLTISGSNTFRNIGPALFDGNLIVTGSTILGSTSISGSTHITDTLVVDNTTTITGPFIYPQLDKSGSIAHGLTGRAQSIWSQQGYVFAVDFINKTISVWRQDPNYTLINVVNNLDLTILKNEGYGPVQVWGDGTYIYISCGGGSISKWDFNTGTETLTLLEEDDHYYSSNFGQIWGDGTYIYAATAGGLNGDGILRVYDLGASVTNYTDQTFGIYTQVYVIDNNNIFTANGSNNPGIRRFNYTPNVFTLIDEKQFDFGPIFGLHSDGTYVYFVSTGVNSNQSLLYAIDKTNLNDTYYSIDLTLELGGGYILSVWCDDTGKIWVSDGVNITSSKLLAYTFDGTTFTKVSSTDFSPYTPVGIVNTMSEYYVLTDTDIWVNSKTLTPSTYGTALAVTGSSNIEGNTIITGSVEITGSLTVNGNAIDRPYKVYTALLSQSGTNTPTAIVLENTLGFEPQWTYIRSGTYGFDFPEPPNYNKIYASIFTGTVRSYLSLNAENNITINNDYNFNNILQNSPIEIRVYN